jgi:hypothetical protein
VEPIAQRGVSALLGDPLQIGFPGVLLHPPSLAFEFSASYGEMSRRSGEAAKEDNHSNISTAAATAPALGAAYEGIYRLPDTADGVRPQLLDRCSNASKAWCAPVPNAARRSCRWAR